MHSHRAENSDDETSVASAKEQVPVKEEQITVISKKRRPTAVVEETQESLMVESDKDGGDEDGEDEPGEDKYGSAGYIRRSQLMDQSADTLWKRLPAIASIM
jgi:hypothetical protein